MKIGDEIYIRANVNEIRKDYIICENAGGYFGTVREEIVSGELRTKQDIVSALEDIKAEINEMDLGFIVEEYKAGIAYAIMKFNQIIDKHINGKENNNADSN